MSVKPVVAKNVDAVKGTTIYPAELASCVAGRTKRKLANVFGLSNFGVNLTDLDPGAVSALYHHHATQDEFVYVVEGIATVVVGEQEFELAAGECIGFPAGTGLGHQVINRSEATVSYLEIGDRSPDDAVEYPNDDIRAAADPNGAWVFTRKNGEPYKL